MNLDHPSIAPLDEHNRRWAAFVHPEDWPNPTPAERYNLLVVGGGPAGLVAALGAAGLGAKVALVEKHLLGGDCLNVGCVPSKALIASLHAVAAVRDAASFGVRVQPDVAVDFPAVMERLRRLRAEMSRHDSAARLQESGVDVFLGDGRFTGKDRFEIGGSSLRFAKACIATGARAAAPPIPGLDAVEHLTNETVFTLTALPKRLGIIGAGPIGCEMAQAFQSFGSEVALIESAHGVLPKEDPEASRIVRTALERDGVGIHCCGKDLKIEAPRAGDGRARLVFESHDRGYDLAVDEVLVAAGRTPNTAGLGLEAAGVATTPKGIRVDDRLRTTNPRIFAAGDVASRFQFTHAADFMARIVISNALFFGRGRASALTIPWATYTRPELAHVGETSEQLTERGVAHTTHRVEMNAVDRAILDGQAEGFVKVHASPRGRILGATIVAERAGDMIGEMSLAMTHGLTLGQIAKAIHPYPTQGEALRKVGDAYNRSRLTPRVARWIATYLRYRR